MAVTKKEIAERLGLSRTAVSLALNNSPNSTLSENTRLKILQTAREMGYKNVSSAKKICCVLFHTVHKEHHNMPCLWRVEEYLEKVDYHLVYKRVLSERDSFASLREFLNNGEADGVIFTGDMTPGALRFINETDVPYVVFSTSESPCKNLITLDVELQTAEAISYLHKLGHKKIALLIGGLETYIHRQNLLAYKKALAAEGLAFDPALVQISSTEDGYELASRLNLLEVPCTAAVAANNAIQFAALQWFKDNNIPVPERISLLAYGVSTPDGRSGTNNTGLQRLSIPNLTTFGFEQSSAARTIVDKLFHTIKTGEKDGEATLLRDLVLFPGGTVKSIPCNG